MGPPEARLPTVYKSRLLGLWSSGLLCRAAGPCGSTRSQAPNRLQVQTAGPLKLQAAVVSSGQMWCIDGTDEGVVCSFEGVAPKGELRLPKLRGCPAAPAASAARLRENLLGDGSSPPTHRMPMGSQMKAAEGAKQTCLRDADPHNGAVLHL